MSLYSPYNDDRIIECVCDCNHKTTKDGRHINCMTTGKRWLRKKNSLMSALATVDYCPRGTTPMWRFVDTVFCDNCDEPFHDIIAWWEDPEVMQYFEHATGITYEDQTTEPQLYICPDCYHRIKEYMKHRRATELRSNLFVAY